MKELQEAAQQAQALFGISNVAPLPGNWVKWYHEGIPDGPKDARDAKRTAMALWGHCLECTSMSGCYFIDGTNTCPKHPHHNFCHCEKQDTGPITVTATCAIEKFTGYIFSEKYAFKGKKKLFEHIFGYTIEDSDALKAEFERQAKEKYISGDYILGKLNRDGQRVDINIILYTPLHGKVTITSGWMIRPNGLITCNTPLGD